MKIANTKTLIFLAKQAAEEGFNRQVNVAALSERLDPDGIHIVSDMMVHSHKAGRKTDPHMRCLVLAKMKNAEEPTEFFLDVKMDSFNILAETSEPVEA